MSRESNLDFIKSGLELKQDELADLTSEALRQAAAGDDAAASVLERQGGKVVQYIRDLAHLHQHEEGQDDDE